jgi:molybdate transport system substrate-binding protein
MLTAMLVILAAGTPKIAASANLSGVLEKVLARCRLEARPTYGATGTLAAQIEQGAPFDLLLAADSATPGKLEAKHVGEDSKLPIEKDGLAALNDPSVRHIAIANPRLAPYGQLALEQLKAAGFDDERRLVIGESVAQAAQFAQSGSAQAALLPLSLALGMKGRHVELRGATLEQRGLVLRDTPETRKVVECLLGEGSRALLEKRGYAPP